MCLKTSLFFDKIMIGEGEGEGEGEGVPVPR